MSMVGKRVRRRYRFIVGLFCASKVHIFCVIGCGLVFGMEWYKKSVKWYKSCIFVAVLAWLARQVNNT